MSAFGELLRREAGVTSGECEVLERHWELLVRWNRRTNLVSDCGMEELVTRHYGESVRLARAVPAGAWRVVDAGSGAGFPGIPFAVVRPECHVTLVESDVKKSVFLREAAGELANVSVVRARLADVSGSFDWLVSRAVLWEDIEGDAVRLSANFALLTSVDRIAGFGSRVQWDEPLALPGGRQRVIAVGHRSVV